jgi:hypothetical protein
MAMRDNLMGVLKDPKRFLRDTARALWLSRTSRDPRERRVAKLQSQVHRTLQFLMTRMVGKKIDEVRRRPVGRWLGDMGKWDPKKDFAPALLHAERLTRMFADVAVSEELLEQSRKHPERGEVLERWLERAEPRSRFLHDEITTTGSRLLAELADGGPEDVARG